MLDKRKQRLLTETVHSYIYTGDPVGSKVLSGVVSDLGVSSATIRAELNRLEKEGFLTQVHCSSGRVPTDKGYRFYVDELKRTGQWKSIIKPVELNLKTMGSSLFDVLDDLSSLVGSLSNNMVFALTPDINQDVLSIVKFMMVGVDKVLVSFVGEFGKYVEFELDVKDEFQQEDLNNLSQCFLDKYQGERYSLLSDHRLEDVSKDIPRLSSLVNALQKKIKDFTIENENKPRLIVNGVSNMLKNPDSSTLEVVKSIVNAIDERKEFVDLLVKHLSKKECSVLIGSETEFEKLKDCSIVLSSYGSKQNPIGMLGMVGPKRMKYSKALSLVNNMKTTLDGYVNKKLDLKGIVMERDLNIKTFSKTV